MRAPFRPSSACLFSARRAFQKSGFKFKGAWNREIKCDAGFEKKFGGPWDKSKRQGKKATQKGRSPKKWTSSSTRASRARSGLSTCQSSRARAFPRPTSTSRSEARLTTIWPIRLTKAGQRPGPGRRGPNTPLRPCGLRRRGNRARGPPARANSPRPDGPRRSPRASGASGARAARAARAAKGANGTKPRSGGTKGAPHSPPRCSMGSRGLLRAQATSRRRRRSRSEAAKRTARRATIPRIPDSRVRTAGGCSTTRTGVARTTVTTRAGRTTGRRTCAPTRRTRRGGSRPCARPKRSVVRRSRP